MLPVAWNAWWMHVGQPGGNPAGYYPPVYTGPWESFAGDVTLFYFLLPYLEQTNLYAPGNGVQLVLLSSAAILSGPPRRSRPSFPRWIPARQNYQDLAYSWLQNNETMPWSATSCHAANFQVFGGARGGNPASYAGWGGTYMLHTIPDGLSKTIFFPENLMVYGAQLRQPVGRTAAGMPTTLPSLPAFPDRRPLFRVQPTQTNCDHTLATAFTSSGILVALGDMAASATWSTGISSTTWGYAVDPADGHVLGSDW